MATIITHTLQNGLRIVAQPMDSLRSVSVGVWVRSGSLKEKEQEAGISHFIEHMLFKGTSSRSARQIAQEMDDIGAQMNAFTGKDSTCYYIKATSEYLAPVMEMLSDMLLHSQLDEEEMQKEKGVVMEEILMAEDTPEDVAFELLARASFGAAPLAQPVLGSQQSVRAFTRQDLQSYMDRHYRAENMLIAVAGRFDEEQLVALAEQYFASIAPLAQPDAYPPTPPRLQKTILTASKDIEQAHIALALPGYGSRDARYFPLAVLNNALGGYMSSRLFQRIREQSGLAYSIYSFMQPSLDGGTLAIYAGTGAAQAGQLMEEVLDELRTLKAEGLSVEELSRSRNQIRGSLVFGNESSNARMNSIGKQTLLFGSARTEEETLALLDGVRMEDIEALLPDVIDERALCAGVVGRDEKALMDLAQLWGQ